MKHNFNFARLGLLVALASGVSSCTPAKPVAEAEYSENRGQLAGHRG